ncbi:minichromosome maintenance protein MCM [Nanoarchaeota archaeon]
MEAKDQIKKFKEFIENHLLDNLMDKVRQGNYWLEIDFVKLSMYEPELAEDLLENPEEVIKAAELAVSEFDFDKAPEFKVRFLTLLDSQKMMIRNIRSANLNKLYSMEGVVRQKSDVRPQVTSAKFECPSCGNIINVLQLDQSFREPSRCSCGRKGKFNLTSKELVDAQGIVLEESPDTLAGGEQPKRMNVFLKDDLVSPLSERKTNPGSKIEVIGFVKEVPIIQRTGIKSVKFDLYIEANNVIPIEETYADVVVSEEEEKEIIELSQDPKIIEKLSDSVAPSIFGYDKIKRALVLQMLGGVQKTRQDGVVSRGDMHILLIGDPGAAKSAMLKSITRIAPKGRYISGKGISAAGLTASVVKDEFLRGWSLEAGAMVLSSDGMCCIDEMDKMGEEDTAAMHEAMENQTVSISKANIQATLIARTTVLAAANPRYGRFDPYKMIADQIDLPPTLINRFDLIFPIKDLPNKERDDALSSHILGLHQDPDKVKPIIDRDLLKKYVSYSRQKIKPALTNEALEEIKSYYLKMRATGSEEGALPVIPISARQLEALVRMSESSARARLSPKVTRQDAQRAVDLLHYSLNQVGLDPETGKIDIDRIATSTSASQRNNIFVVKEIISDLEGKIGKTIPIDDVVQEGKLKGISNDKVDEIIEKLKRSGDIFEPRKGFIQKI